MRAGSSVTLTNMPWDYAMIVNSIDRTNDTINLFSQLGNFSSAVNPRGDRLLLATYE